MSAAPPDGVLESARLLLTRSDHADDDAVIDFFVRNVDHLHPWLPEAAAIAQDPGFRVRLWAHTEAERRADHEERWFVALREDPARVVGYVFLTRFRRDGHRSCELSYGVDRALAGKGFMREAVERALTHARDVHGFSRVDARYAVENDASARLLDRLGFLRVGVAPQHAWIDGAWRDHVIVTRVERAGPPA